MYFFQEFPKTFYNVKGNPVNLVDITVRVKLLDYIKNNRDNLIINDYEIENEKRPEEVSYEIYEDYEFTWTILVLNDVYSIYTDWVKAQDVLEKDLIRKYGSIENSNNKIIAYYDQYGHEVGATSPSRAKSLTAYEKAIIDNEKRKNIKVFDTIVINRVQVDLSSEIIGI